MKKSKKIKIFKIIILILTTIIIVAGTIYMFPVLKKLNTLEGQLAFKQKVDNSRAIGMFTIVGLEIAQIFLAILPGEPIEILAGICYGSVYGSIIIIASVLITTTIIYFLVNKFGKKFIYEFFPKEKIDKLEKSKLLKNEKKIEIIMTILFLIPGTPKDLLVYIGGLLPIKASRFIVMATVLRIPSIVSSTIAGDKLIEGKWQISILVYAITFIIISIVIIVINKIDNYRSQS